MHMCCHVEKLLTVHCGKCLAVCLVNKVLIWVSSWLTTWGDSRNITMAMLTGDKIHICKYNSLLIQVSNTFYQACSKIQVNSCLAAIHSLRTNESELWLLCNNKGRFRTHCSCCILQLLAAAVTVCTACLSFLPWPFSFPFPSLFHSSSSMMWLCWIPVVPRDIAPEGEDLAETNSNLDQVVELASKLQDKSGVRPLWGTAQLFKHPRYMHGVATSMSTIHRISSVKL